MFCSRAALRLVGDANSCQGLLEIRPASSTLFGQACDLNAGDNEAKAICRQLNCDVAAATRADSIE